MHFSALSDPSGYDQPFETSENLTARTKMEASDVEFHAMQQRAMQIRQAYAEMERSRYGRSWSDEELALGFVGDVGDLVQLVQARNGVRAIPDADKKLAHELSDCLWSVIVLSQIYGVDLEHSFLETMDELEQLVQGVQKSRPN